MALINTLIQALPPGADYSIIDINQPEIMFSGRVKNQDEVLAMVGNLEMAQLFSEVRIASMSYSNNGELNGCQFQIALEVKPAD